MNVMEFLCDGIMRISKSFGVHIIYIKIKIRLLKSDFTEFQNQIF